MSSSAGRREQNCCGFGSCTNPLRGTAWSGYENCRSWAASVATDPPSMTRSPVGPAWCRCRVSLRAPRKRSSTPPVPVQDGGAEDRASMAFSASCSASLSQWIGQRTFGRASGETREVCNWRVRTEDERRFRGGCAIDANGVRFGGARWSPAMSGVEKIGRGSPSDALDPSRRCPEPAIDSRGGGGPKPSARPVCRAPRPVRSLPDATLCAKHNPFRSAPHGYACCFGEWAVGGSVARLRRQGDAKA